MSGASLTLRAYNVLFGDAVLLTLSEPGAKARHMLVDLGNALAGQPGQDSVFEPVLRDIVARTGGILDLYVMTHEHMDHVQGPLYGARKLGLPLQARRVWMTASSAPDYYDRFALARKQKNLALTALAAADDLVRAVGADAMPAGLMGLAELNNPRASRDCVDFIAAMGMDAVPPRYVFRKDETATPEADAPFADATFRILAPEEDTAIYYRPLGPAVAGVSAGMGAVAGAYGAAPPPGVAAGAFFDLLDFRAGEMADNLRSIDKAANNSSVVIEVEWRGWRLLLAGDAEERSWEIMRRHGLLRPVHFLKVSHHGSHNGSPAEEIDLVLPHAPLDDRPRYAVVSTAVGAYSGVPDSATLALIATRATLLDTRDVPPGAAVEVVFPDPDLT
ncbi:MAG: hypothetical protein WAT09_00560 [Paracoccaceae bacterium]